ncbi:hypothetical protein Lnau_1848 [Legionella nautarum]|uniref:Uncharacterized protein n=1 Tax=Legionella nautarum TaxID=45070 RepID=A0A0W0WS73_9GAMM|nr:hypothetical protein Lnau_1848 [Legionella nautarum]
MKPCFSNASFKQINNTIRVPTIGIVGVTIPGALNCISKINQKSNHLVLNKANCGVVTIDTTDILAEAAVQYTLNLIHSMDDNSHKIDSTFR